MKSVITVVALAFVAVTSALPLDLGGNSDIIKDDMKSWRNDFLLGGQKIHIGVGWRNDGTIAAGGKIVADINGQELPISAAVTTNIHNEKPLEQLKYEVGTQIFEKIAAVLYGSVDGALKYLISAAAPISTEGKSTAVGVSLEGDHLKLKTVSAGVGYGQEVVQAIVGLGDNYAPETINVQLGGNPNDFN